MRFSRSSKLSSSLAIHHAVDPQLPVGRRDQRYRQRGVDPVELVGRRRPRNSPSSLYSGRRVEARRQRQVERLAGLRDGNASPADHSAQSADRDRPEGHPGRELEETPAADTVLRVSDETDQPGGEEPEDDQRGDPGDERGDETGLAGVRPGGCRQDGETREQDDDGRARPVPEYGENLAESGEREQNDEDADLERGLVVRPEDGDREVLEPRRNPVDEGRTDRHDGRQTGA